MYDLDNEILLETALIAVIGDYSIEGHDDSMAVEGKEGGVNNSIRCATKGLWPKHSTDRLDASG